MLAEEGVVHLSSQEEFAVMMQEFQTTYNSWVTKAERGLTEDTLKLRREIQAFEEDKVRVYQDFQAQKQVEYDRIREDRRRAELEAANATRQIKAERDDHRSKLEEDRGAIHRDVMQGKRRYLLEREKFRSEYEAAEKERQRVAEHNTATETVVELNVGGEVFEAARLTLTQQPGSYLERMLTGRVHVPRDRDGRIFLDRDSSLFRVILNFLRDPSTPPSSRDAADSEALVTEADDLGIRYFPYPQVYAVGGHDGSDHVTLTELLDVENQVWRGLRPMSTPRAYFGAESHLSRLYLFGGQNLQFRALCETELFDCLRGVWLQGPDLNIPRRNCAAAKIDGRIFAIGGYDGTTILDAVEAYDPRMKNWMPIEKMGVQRSASAATAYGGKIWVLGGTSGSRRRDGERYDPVAARWEHIGADMIEVRSAAQAVTCLDRLYVMGGTEQSQIVHQSMESYSPVMANPSDPLGSGSWSYRKSMQYPRVDFGACVLSDSIMVAGGQHGEVLDGTEFYRPEVDDWQLGPSLMSPRYGHQLLTVQI